MGPRAKLDVVEKKNRCHCWKIETTFLVRNKTVLLIAWSEVVLEKLMAAQLANIFSACY
jgi:hypothetical protein